jgi:hypothetical protein
MRGLYGLLVVVRRSTTLVWWKVLVVHIKLCLRMVCGILLVLG